MIASISPKGPPSPFAETLRSIRRPPLRLAPLHVAPAPTTVRPSPSARPFFRTFSKNGVDGAPRSNRDRSDPTAGRPTTKCDPYGLSGRSLSWVECRNLMATLEDGWRLAHGAEIPEMGRKAPTSGEGGVADSAEERTPSFLRKQFYHRTFYDASRFLSRVSLLATNIHHYPYLSMERVLVDDMNEFQDSIAQSEHRSADDDDEGGSKTTKRRRKVKGWVFLSTVRCSTYRPFAKNRSTGKMQDTGNDNMHNDKGLTYHDFHLAMNIDVEASRDELKQFLLKHIH